jgi:hypothetical protein
MSEVTRVEPRPVQIARKLEVLARRQDRTAVVARELMAAAALGERHIGLENACSAEFASAAALRTIFVREAATDQSLVPVVLTEAHKLISYEKRREETDEDWEKRTAEIADAGLARRVYDAMMSHFCFKEITL